jgi:hypothetical protein
MIDWWDTHKLCVGRTMILELYFIMLGSVVDLRLCGMENMAIAPIFILFGR